MNLLMLIDHFNITIDGWIDALDHYSFSELLFKPDPDNWSLGQVYMHLLNETQYYISQIEYCLSHEENAKEKMKDAGAVMFANNSFPDERIKGDPGITSKIGQPASKEQLIQGMLALKDEMNKNWTLIVRNENNGKTRHPGLGYFNAIEWFQFAEMHLRHHFRQKIKIDKLLRK
jgi:hypothetical protein